MFLVSKKAGISILLILPTLLTTAQDTETASLETSKPDEYTLGLQIRPRTEYRNGYKTQTTDEANPAFLTTQRTRLFFGYKTSLFDSKLSIQDIRTWGEEPNKADVSSIDLHEAWVELFLSKKISIKLGRQELKYDDQRLLAWTDWNQNASSHDIAIFKYKNNNFDAHLGLAYNNEKEILCETYYALNFYKTMQFLYLSNQYDNGLKLSFLEIADGNQKENSAKIIYVRTTYGINAVYENTNSNIGFSGSFFKQNGQNKTGENINAFFIGSSLSYKINKNLKPVIGIDYYSGSDGLDTTKTTSNSFSNLYGAGYKFLGIMNYFTSVDKHTKDGGIIDIFGKINYKFSPKLNFESAYHVFSLANNVTDPNVEGAELKAIDKSLGSELDLILKLNVSNTLNFNFGFAHMFAKESMDVIKGGDYKQNANWVYVMITVSPQITKTMK